MVRGGQAPSRFKMDDRKPLGLPPVQVRPLGPHDPALSQPWAAHCCAFVCAWLWVVARCIGCAGTPCGQAPMHLFVEIQKQMSNNVSLCLVLWNIGHGGAAPKARDRERHARPLGGRSHCGSASQMAVHVALCPWFSAPHPHVQCTTRTCGV